MTIYRVATIGHLQIGNEWQNVAHYEFTAYDPTVAEQQDFIDNLDASYKVELAPTWSNETGIDSYTMRRVDIGALPTGSFVATAGAFNGASSGDNLPKQSAGLVTFGAFTVFPRTTRTYLPPCTEVNSNANGEPDTVYINAMDLWALGVLTVPVVGQVAAIKNAVKYGGTPRAVIASNPVLSTLVKVVWASQRRRRIGI